MKIRSFALLTISIASVAVAGIACSKKSGGGSGSETFHGRAHFIVASKTTANASAFAPAFAAPADGRWYLSPDQAKVTITRITLVGTGNNVAAFDFTDCTPTYSRDQAAGTQLLECPFDMRGGTYLGAQVYLSSDSAVLFNDTANGIFTDASTPSGFSATAPAAGPQFIPFAPGGSGNTFALGAFLDQPFVFGTGGNGASTDVYLALDMVHTVFGNVTGGAMTLDASLPIPPAFVIPGVGAPPKQIFYTSTGTANSVKAPCPVGCPSNDENESVRISYSPGATQPFQLFGPQFGQVEPVDPATSAVFPDGCKRGGYLGFDGSKLCWAMPADCLFTSYTQLCEMTLSSNLGGTSTIACQQMTSVPAPTSGSTYASGCPAITPDYTQTLTLVAE